MKIAILGAGESGVGAALLAQKTGAEAWVSDKGRIAEKYEQVLREHQIPFETGQHTEEKFFEADIIVKSPGIPDRAPLVQALKAKGKPVISEIEFAARHTGARIIAVTGSNGKTTTTSLIFHLVKAAGLDAGLGGNIGNSFAWLVATTSHAWYVLEISSFQLDDIVEFRPDIAVLLNITPDHLDRYDYRMENYAAAKFRITENQRNADLFIYGASDPVTAETLAHTAVAARKMGFAEAKGPGIAAWMEGMEMVLESGFRMDTGDMKLLGRHNALNAMAAVLAAQAAGLDDEEIRAGLRSFQPIEHRLEPVATVAGVAYINDSKATNVDAVGYALESMKKPTIWLAGGVDKGNDYVPLVHHVREKVKVIIVLGEYIEKFFQHFDHQDIYQVMSMQEAVQLASGLAVPGDTVLLSPACASFDLFKNYEDRGKQFKEAVNDLENSKS